MIDGPSYNRSTFSRFSLYIATIVVVRNPITTMSLPDKEPAELDVLYEPCALLPEAEEMGSLLPGLQASAGYGQKPRQRPFLLGPVSDGDGFARRSDQAPAEGKLFITARARKTHNLSLKKRRPMTCRESKSATLATTLPRSCDWPGRSVGMLWRRREFARRSSSTRT